MLADLGGWILAGGVLTSAAAALLWLRAATDSATGPIGDDDSRDGTAPARGNGSTTASGGANAAGSITRPARVATGLSLVAAVGACATLEWALLRHDFSVRFVAENGGRDVPLYYTVTSLWSALDGSLLLWLLMLSGYAAVLSRRAAGRRPGPAGPDPRGPTRRLDSYAMVVVSAVGVFFFALTYFAANPFRAVQPVPLDGPGPNPLLQQHPAMGLHPPLLYAGYIGLVVPFAYAVAALFLGRADGRWLRAARPWALLAWAMLTAGIALGAWWSYAVLGWGGYWAWDPVENASLLPWLTATAFLHSTLGGRRAGARTGWSVALAGASFVLVLVGTFLTRSGAVASVHAFTESPLGPLLLGFVLLAATAVTGLVGWRGHRLSDAGAGMPVLSRGTALLANAVLLVTLAAVVLIGTVFPLVTQALDGARTVVGAPYFNRTAVPLAVALLALAGLAPMLRWGGQRPGEVVRRLRVPAGVALATVLAVGLFSRPGPAALTAFGAAAFVLAGLPRLVAGQVRTVRPGALPRELVRRRRALAGLVAHAGIALVALGVAASSAYPASDERRIGVGETIRVRGASVRLQEVAREGGAGGMAVTARLALVDGGTTRAIAPRLRYYPAHDVMVSIPHIDTGLTRDVYVTLVAVADDGRSATVRLAVNPLVGLIWVGGALTALGGLLALPGRAAGTPPQRPAARIGRPAPTVSGARS